MGRTRTVLLLLVGALVAAGCNRIQPVYEAKAHPVPAVARTKLSEAQVGDVIRQAATQRQWLIEPTRPGHFRGTLDLRNGKHSAVADIYYSTEQYSITLNSSNNLKQDGGEIHRTYNNNVRALEAEIERALYRASY